MPGILETKLDFVSALCRDEARSCERAQGAAGRLLQHVFNKAAQAILWGVLMRLRHHQSTARPDDKPLETDERNRIEKNQP